MWSRSGASKASEKGFLEVDFRRTELGRGCHFSAEIRKSLAPKRVRFRFDKINVWQQFSKL